MSSSTQRSRLAGALFLSLGLAIAGCAPDVPNLYSSGTAIVCLGDSITAGVGSGVEPGYPELLSRHLGRPVVSHGVPGDTAAQGRARLEAVLAEDPWLVIVELGGNDLLRRIPPEQTERSLAAIVEGVLAAGAVPLLVEIEGPGPLIPGLGPVFERLEERYGVPVLDGVLDGILLDPALKSDTIHPNAEGYKRLAEALARRVRPWLEARAEAGLEPTTEAR